MKKLLGMTLVALLLTVFGLSTFRAPSAAAVGKADVCQGLDAAVSGGTSSTCDTPSGSPTVEGTVATVIRIVSWVVGVIAVIMVMVGGFQYVTSGGDSGKVTSAKNVVMYALVGIVIVVLAQVIVTFVVKKAG